VGGNGFPHGHRVIFIPKIIIIIVFFFGMVSVIRLHQC
jgi:hypothetical protein